MINFLKEKILENISVKKKLIVDKVINENINKANNILYNCIKKNKKIMFCGNGGSCADAQHLATELSVRLRPHVNRKGINSIALSLGPAYLTACGNDYGFENIYSRSIEALSKKGDILIAISTSGDSKNIIKAIQAAKKNGVKTISFLGSNGGKAKGIADIDIIVPSKITARIQETHIFLGHIMLEILENRLLKKGYI